jgi:hypothetical protein
MNEQVSAGALSTPVILNEAQRSDESPITLPSEIHTERAIIVLRRSAAVAILDHHGREWND